MTTSFTGDLVNNTATSLDPNTDLLADYVTPMIVTTDPAGAVTITGTNTSGGITLINGVVIDDVIPEPASAALLGLGGLAMLRRRRS